MSQKSGKSARIESVTLRLGKENQRRNSGLAVEDKTRSPKNAPLIQKSRLLRKLSELAEQKASSNLMLAASQVTESRRQTTLFADRLGGDPSPFSEAESKKSARLLGQSQRLATVSDTGFDDLTEMLRRVDCLVF